MEANRLRLRRMLTSVILLVTVVVYLGESHLEAAGLQSLRGYLPTANARSAPLGRLQSTQRLNLAIGLPLRNQVELTTFLRDLNDPTSPNYRRYLTPQQFTERFGPTDADYQAVVAFAKAHGLNVTATYPNRLLLDVEGAVPDIEKTFHVTMWSYQHPTEARKFYAPDSEPSVDLAVPLVSISGLNNYALPHPRLKLGSVKNLTATAASAKSGAPYASPTLGSGPNGSGYMGSDFRTAYVPGTSLTGAGQTVGLLQFDGYTASDITYYEGKAGLGNVPITNVLLDGFEGGPTGDGGELEVSLDIEMAMSMAPGLSGIIVYMAGPYGNWHDMLNRMVTDNLAKQIGCSWYSPGSGADSTADLIFQEMAAQGQSFFDASGDDDAFTALIPFPGDTPYITQVGGTMLTTNGAGGSYTSEAAWNRNNGVGTGGGISTQYTIPTWQQGISMANNQGSTTMRNVPDVALTAESVYVRADGFDYTVGGTSCAAPLWAGFTALVNQQTVSSTGTTVGFLNPALYTIAKGSSYASNFHDTATGNNFSTASPSAFSAVTGYDLCTGLGSPFGSALINSLAGSPTPIIFTPSPLPSALSGRSYSYTLTANGGRGSYTWSLASGSLPTGLNLSSGGVISGTPSATGVATFTAKVTDSHGIFSTSTFTLTVYATGTPVIVSTAPLPNGTTYTAYSQTLTANGGTTPYTWSFVSGGTPSGLSLSYSFPGTSAKISGTPTTAGPSGFTLKVTGNDGVSSTTSFVITIIQGPTPPTISTSALSAGILNASYNQALAATGGTTPYTWALSSGGLPTGLNLSSAGVISGTPTVRGTSNFSVKVTGANGLSTTAAFSIAVYPTGTLLANGSFETGDFSSWVTTDLTNPYVSLAVRSNGYNTGYGLFTSTATDGNYSATCGFDGGGPGTIQIAQDIAVSAAAPIVLFDYRVGWDMLDYTGSTQARTFTVTVQPSGGGSTLATSTVLSASPRTRNLDTGALTGAMDLTAYVGTSVRLCFNVSIPDNFTGPGFFELDNVRVIPPVNPVIITTSPLPNGVVGTAYSQTLIESGGTAPYTWSKISGSLPANLTLSSSGAITGTPTATGTASFTAQVADANNNKATQTFTLSVVNSFTSWESLYFSAQQMQTADPTVIGPNATPQEDGVSNLLKFLFDINPAVAMSDTDRAALPQIGTTTIGTTTYLILTYRMNPTVSGITVNFDATSDLTSSGPPVTPDLDQMVGTDSKTGDPIMQVGVKMSGATKEFLRLNVTMP